MPMNLQVVLQSDVEKLGKSGELLKVRPGYARNYLVPRGLAVFATESAVARVKHEKAVAIAISRPLMSGRTKAILRSPSKAGLRSELLRSRTEPALKALGGATGATFTTRPFFSARTIRSSSGVSPVDAPLPLKATAPMPGAVRPEPDIEPVALPSTNAISAECTEPATAFSTNPLHRAPAVSDPETMLAMSW